MSIETIKPEEVAVEAISPHDSVEVTEAKFTKLFTAFLGAFKSNNVRPEENFDHLMYHAQSFFDQLRGVVTSVVASAVALVGGTDAAFKVTVAKPEPGELEVTLTVRRPDAEADTPVARWRTWLVPVGPVNGFSFGIWCQLYPEATKTMPTGAGHTPELVSVNRGNLKIDVEELVS